LSENLIRFLGRFKNSTRFSALTWQLHQGFPTAFQGFVLRDDDLGLLRREGQPQGGLSGRLPEKEMFLSPSYLSAKL
jgi:hypothetical protein